MKKFIKWAFLTNARILNYLIWFILFLLLIDYSFWYLLFMPSIPIVTLLIEFYLYKKAKEYET